MSEQIEKLKKSVRKDYAKIFELNQMISSGFIPVDNRNNNLYVILNKEQLVNKPSIVELIKNKKPEFEPQFIPIEPVDFNDVINYVSNKLLVEASVLGANTENVIKSTSSISEPTAEEMLVGIGWITKEQLIEVSNVSLNEKIPIDEVFRQKGYLSQDQIISYLRKKHNCDVVLAKDISIDPNISKLLPDDFIEKKRAIPMSMEGKKLAVAMVDPSDKYTIREISLSTGRALSVYCIPYSEYEIYLRDLSVNKKVVAQAKETERIIQSIEQEAAQFDDGDSLWAQVEKELQDSSGNVAKFVYKIITDAIDAKASDIHIEPRLGYYVVRLRADGMLKKVLEIPSSIEQSVITRFKVLARMNIAEHRRPQDGTFSIKYNDRMYDFRINTLPVSGKEKVVIRILAPAVSLSASGEKMVIVGASDDDLQKIHDMVQSPNGIILTSGPTG